MGQLAHFLKNLSLLPVFVTNILKFGACSMVGPGKSVILLVARFAHGPGKRAKMGKFLKTYLLLKFSSESLAHMFPGLVTIKVLAHFLRFLPMGSETGQNDPISPFS